MVAKLAMKMGISDFFVNLGQFITLLSKENKLMYNKETVDTSDDKLYRVNYTIYFLYST